MKDSDNPPAWFWILALFVALVCWVLSSYVEARAFNSATGANVSTWDAMFVDLKIQGAPK